MNDPAIIEAEYVEWKMVKTRKALQLIFEVPLERQALVQAALGTPMPDTSTPVAIARLLPPEQRRPEPIAEIVHRKPASFAQIAGIICNEGAFQKFTGCASADEAAQYVRDRCGVDSRAKIDGNESAERAFRDLKGEYDAWMLVAA